MAPVLHPPAFCSSCTTALVPRIRWQDLYRCLSEHCLPFSTRTRTVTIVFLLHSLTMVALWMWCRADRLEVMDWIPGQCDCGGILIRQNAKLLVHFDFNAQEPQVFNINLELSTMTPALAQLLLWDEPINEWVNQSTNHLLIYIAFQFTFSLSLSSSGSDILEIGNLEL